MTLAQCIHQYPIVLTDRDHLGLAFARLCLIILLEPKLSETDHPLLHRHDDVLHVAGPSVGVSIGKTHTVESSRVMNGRLESLDVNGKLMGIAADPPCCPPSSICQKVSEPLPVGDLFEKSQDGVHITPRELQTVGVPDAEQAFFIALHRECDRRPTANRIHAVSITHLIGFGYGREIVIEYERSEGRTSLILWPWSFIDPIRPLTHLDHPLAGNWTERARMGPN